jgi:hypothetical protein
MGKSRMLLEASHKIFAVIMNFGSNSMACMCIGLQVSIPQKDQTSLGYPSPNIDIRDYLTGGVTPKEVME